MEKITGKLTVCFEGPFWVGVFERLAGGKLTACKVTFGGEPRDQEVYDFVLRHYASLEYGPPVDAPTRPPAKSPKRIRREARRQTAPAGIGTKSQQPLQRSSGRSGRSSGRRKRPGASPCAGSGRRRSTGGNDGGMR